MAQGTKITFSEAELDAITHPDFFYLKHSAMNKVMEILSETERKLGKILLTNPRLKEHTDADTPKIFRGENYRQLPYMVLDYPRKFSAETVFAYRTMFWWGREFSFTLHLQGKAVEHFRKNINEKIALLEGQDFYLCVNKSPWQYYFEDDNYLRLDNLLKDGNHLENLLSKEFIKLSRKIPVKEFDLVPVYSEETLEILLKILL